MTREYKVTIVEQNTGEILACRVKDEGNFLPVSHRDNIMINDKPYFVWNVRYIIGDIWEQIIYVVE